MKERARIVHGSHLRLDHPVRGVRRWGQVRREIFRDCTLLALRKLVEQVQGERADLLLLTGPCCPEDGLGPRGALALSEACRSLAQSRIPVVLAVADGELIRQGFAGRGWPHNLHLLELQSGNGLNVVGAGGQSIEVLSTELHAPDNSAAGQSVGRPLNGRSPQGLHTSGSHSNGSLSNETPHPGSTPRGGLSAPASLEEGPVRIGVAFSGERLLLSDSPLSIVGGVPLDAASSYVATCEPPRRRTLNVGGTIVHSPGPLQGLTAIEPGLCGATLVELGADLETRLTLLPTAAFVWEQWGLEGISGESRSGLLSRMLDVVEQHLADRASTPCCVRWNLAAEEWPGDLDGSREELDCLLEEVETRAAQKGWQLANQSFLKILPGRGLAGGDPLLEEYASLLTENSAASRESLHQWTATVASQWQCDPAELERLLGGTAWGRVSREALSWGRQWLLEREGRLP
jgi:hypothetical protein